MAKTTIWSKMMMAFNMSQGKFRWLRLLFGLQVAGDVFQERLNRVLRRVLNICNSTDDILSHGKAESQHDAIVITLLLETREKAIKITFNAEKFIFKFQDCTFIGGTSPYLKDLKWTF